MDFTNTFHPRSTYIIEHRSVCLLVGIGTPPTPLPQASVPSPPPEPKGGGGVPIPTTVEKAEHSAYSVPSLHIKRFTVTHNKLSAISTDGQLIIHSSSLLTSWDALASTNASDVWNRESLQVKMFSLLFEFNLKASTNR